MIAGEYETGLVAWVDGEDPGPPIQLARVETQVPARHLLPPLDRYTRLAVGGEERLVGSVEASRGCSHRCRHCPVPVVYGGRVRPVDVAVSRGRYRPAGGGRCPPRVLRRPGLPQRPTSRSSSHRSHARASSEPDLRLHDQGGAHPAPPWRSTRAGRSRLRIHRFGIRVDQRRNPRLPRQGSFRSRCIQGRRARFASTGSRYARRGCRSPPGPLSTTWSI